jgi:hypothetical protein
MRHRAVVLFVTLIGLDPREIHAKLVRIYVGDALVLQTFDKWQKRVAQGRTDFFDNLLSGQPLENDHAESVGAVF